MKRDRSKDAPKSALDLANELAWDADYAAKMADRTRDISANRLAYDQAVAPIVGELRRSGFEIRSVGDLRKLGQQYPAAVPVLVRWLPVVRNSGLKEDIVRTLSVPWAATAEVNAALLKEFVGSDEGANEGLRWAIANALSVTADDSIFEELTRLLRDKKYGKAREMLAVALANCTDPRAVVMLTELLNDDQVCGHAVIALGLLRAQTARLQIEKLLTHPKRWIRNEATKALARIDPLPVSDRRH